MLCISDDNILETTTHEAILEAVRNAFLVQESGTFLMPTRMHVHTDPNTLLLMPCVTESVFGTKLVNVFPENASLHLPVISGTMILNDGKTGAPLALINATALTALRTGAVGATGIKLITADNIDSIGIIGAGVQGIQQAVFASKVRSLKTIFVFDSQQEQIAVFRDQLEQIGVECEVIQTGTANELIERTDTVVIATTSTVPVFAYDSNSCANKTFIGIGSYKPDMREFPDELYPSLSKIFVDTMHALKESGDLLQPLEKGLIERDTIQPLSQLIRSNGPRPTHTAGTYLFKSVGMALFDIVVAETIYRNAVDKGVGISVSL